ncbi:MAG: hypothetical protein J5543_06855 [Bacteroidales bacterium]|nr:hypothetical protein [Bacteroidales bacterium]
MKKFYSTILALIFCSSALLAQEETSFAFMLGDEVIPNGGTVTISEYEDLDFMIEMHAAVYVKNVCEDATKLSLTCVGKENYNDIQFCPNNNCIPWNEEGQITTNYMDAIQPGATVEQGKDWLHAQVFDTKSFKGSVELKAYCTLDPEDCTSITVIFDTDAQGINKVISDNNKMEVYNLCGKKIAESTKGLAKGIYIIKQNGASRKVVIK